MATATKKTNPAKATANNMATAKKTTLAKAETPAAEPKTKPAPKHKTPGVHAKVTRPYLAGQIIREQGLAAGVTPAMVAELNERYGKPNDVESTFCLKNAWHSCRAYAGVAEDAIT